jgi:hypothetical protein
MTEQYETVFRELRPDPTDRELKELYTLTKKDLAFIDATAKRNTARLALAIHFKAFHYLGYFIRLKDVPAKIKQHIAQGLGIRRMPTDKELDGYDTSGHKRVHIEAIRRHFDVRPLSMKRDQPWLEALARKAAETKHNVPDIINQMIEELLRQRYELPGITVLVAIATAARATVHDGYLNAVSNALTPEAKQTIDGLLKRGNDPLTGWNALKREPRRPTNREARFWLQHIERLRRLADQMPPLDIPIPKLRFFREWARALDATQLSRLKGPRLYGLAAIYIHAQRGNALDDAVDMFLRLIQRLENLAVRKLQEHRLAQGAEWDALVKQLRDILLAYKTTGTDEQRILAIDDSLAMDVDALLKACDEHLAIQHRNYLPFLVEPYESVRRLLINCLDIVELQALDDGSESRKLLEVVKQLRSVRKRQLTYDEAGLQPADLKWLEALWRSHVVRKDSSGQEYLDRIYLELSILYRIRDELKSGDLFVPKGERFDDFRDHLVDDERLAAELAEYGMTTGIEVEPERHLAKLKVDLKMMIDKVDRRFPDNAYAEIVDGKLSLKRLKRPETSAEVRALDEMISERMTPVNIVDVLIDTCRWLNLHKEFRTIAEGQGRIADLLPRVVTTLLCYGCNLGPVQTERSVRGISRKQVSWINHQYIKEDTLNRCITKAINRYSTYRLPRFWGTGKSASADGTHWRLYEQNLISERHIRYGAYGGIGYYHVSDTYIALMSHFTTCGTYEAVYILDGMLNNKSEIQPDTVHGDTQAQSLPVFALAHLLGIKLMPRIRQLKDLDFSRAEEGHRCEHINALFSDDIDWALIERHFNEMLRIAVSIKVGVITASSILRRLGVLSAVPWTRCSVRQPPEKRHGKEERIVGREAGRGGIGAAASRGAQCAGRATVWCQRTVAVPLARRVHGGGKGGSAGKGRRCGGGSRGGEAAARDRAARAGDR